MNHAIISARLPGPPPRFITEAVCAHLKITPEEIHKRDNRPYITYARNLVFYLCRNAGGHKLIYVAHHFKRNHTTVLRGQRIVEGWLSVGDEKAIADLRTILQAIVHS